MKSRPFDTSDGHYSLLCHLGLLKDYETSSSWDGLTGINYEGNFRQDWTPRNNWQAANTTHIITQTFNAVFSFKKFLFFIYLHLFYTLIWNK